ncbi:hypothetical protein DPMN_036866 [Dreissena polymorpha]|uniref:Uncharacterized protein n=1 Tax=Dreissena polymorpha TaxID=45954 RepID=A0A9D4RM99_DREPO|nr:hypothetical protein DPMN_036866 [Dreissena polymorpha]
MSDPGPSRQLYGCLRLHETRRYSLILIASITNKHGGTNEESGQIRGKHCGYTENHVNTNSDYTG